MAFHLETKTKTKVLEVKTLASKGRAPDELPGAQLLLRATLSVESLAMFDGFMPGALYRKAGAGAQGALDGLEGSELTNMGEHVKRMPWEYEQTGVSLEVDRGLGGKRNLHLQECTMHSVVIFPKQGGSVEVQWKIDAPGLSDEMRGKLTGLKATEVELTLALPDVDDSQAVIPGTEGTDPNAKPGEPGRGKPGQPYPFPKSGKPQGVVPDAPADATSTFVEAHGKRAVVLDGKR